MNHVVIEQQYGSATMMRGKPLTWPSASPSFYWVSDPVSITSFPVIRPSESKVAPRQVKDLPRIRVAEP